MLINNKDLSFYFKFTPANFQTQLNIFFFILKIYIVNITALNITQVNVTEIFISLRSGKRVPVT